MRSATNGTQIHIRNGRLIDPQNGIDGRHDLYIVDGRIAAVGSAPAGFAAEQTIDAAGCVVCPGLVDLSTRLGGLESELEAAVARGLTALARPPGTHRSTNRASSSASCGAAKRWASRASSRSAR